jgi:hypothetical protein
MRNLMKHVYTFMVVVALLIKFATVGSAHGEDENSPTREPHASGRSAYVLTHTL